MTVEALARFLRDLRRGRLGGSPSRAGRVLAEPVEAAGYGTHPRPHTPITSSRLPGDASQGVDTAPLVTPTGAWSGHAAVEPHHCHDARLSDAILQYLRSLEGVRTVYDLGCGDGKYAAALVAAGYFCVGVDGNPATQRLTGGSGVTADLGLPIRLPRADAVICLEVGEHVPLDSEPQLLTNLDALTGRHLILSWAVPGQGGLGHVNELPNAAVQERLAPFGFVADETASARLRASSTFAWFKNTLMVFHRGSEAPRMVAAEPRPEGVRGTLSPEELVDRLARMDRGSPFFAAASRLLDRVLVTGGLPEPAPPGRDRAATFERFRENPGSAVADPIVSTVSEELDGPFHFFDAIYCINLDRDSARWESVANRFARLGILRRVRRFPAIETPTSHHIGCALSHRAIVQEARQQGLDNVLVFEDDVVFSPTAREDLARSIRELKTRTWHTLYLGGHRWGQTFELLPGCQALEQARGLTCTHAIAYGRAIFDRILDDVPDTPTAMALWLRTHHGIDQYYAFALAGLHLVTRPVVASQASILGQETLQFEP